MKYLKMYEEFKISNDIDIPTLVNSYLETALWTEEERLENEAEDNVNDFYGTENDDEDDEDSVKNLIPKIEFKIDNIDNDSKIQAYLDIKKFLEYAGDAIEGIDETQLGHDIWLTRNHHGSGFFDRDYSEETTTILTNAAHKLGEVSMYIGDDNIIYIE